jgi:predicted DNA binding CopG/RHH family protein
MYHFMKNRRLDIKLTDYELQQLEEEAERRGMNKSELIRSLIARFSAPIKSRPALR